VSLSRDLMLRPPNAVSVLGNRAPLFWRLLRQSCGVHFGDMGFALGVRQLLPRHAFEVIRLCVASLFLRCRPATICGTVRAVVVNAVNRVVWRRAAPHVGDEGFVRMSPAVTDDNTARPVVLESNVLRIAASGFHPFPDFILRRGLSHARFSMRALGDSSVAPHQTAAPLASTSAAKIAGCPDGLATAVAVTEPLPAAEVYHRNEFVEPLTREVTMHLTILRQVNLALA
jgi:hypothetical protein